MKKRRTIIISLLLVAALCLGIGYAGFAIDLIVKGSATLRAEAPNVVFSAASVDTDPNKTTTGISAGLGAVGEASINIDSSGFESVGDILTVHLTIKNNHNFEVSVSEPQIVRTQINGEDYFEVTTNWGTGAKTLGATGTASSEQIVTLTIKQIKDTSDELTQKYTVTFKASQGSQAPATTAAGNP